MKEKEEEKGLESPKEDTDEVPTRGEPRCGRPGQYRDRSRPRLASTWRCPTKGSRTRLLFCPSPVPSVTVPSPTTLTPCEPPTTVPPPRRRGRGRDQGRHDMVPETRNIVFSGRDSGKGGPRTSPKHPKPRPRYLISPLCSDTVGRDGGDDGRQDSEVLRVTLLNSPKRVERSGGPLGLYVVRRVGAGTGIVVSPGS